MTKVRTLSIALLALAGSAATGLAQDGPRRLETNVQGVTLDVELRKTEDGYLTLRGLVRNESGRRLLFQDISGSLVEYVTLVDNRNRRRHSVVKDSGGKCLCSDLTVASGETGRFWAKFAAPPEGVSKMDVYANKLEPVTVPITDGAAPTRSEGTSAQQKL